jgi:hypothetical protein
MASSGSSSPPVLAAPLTPPPQPVFPRSNRAKQAQVQAQTQNQSKSQPVQSTPSAPSKNAVSAPIIRATPFSSQPSSTTASTPSTRALITPSTAGGSGSGNTFPSQGPQMYRGDLAKMTMSRPIPSSASTSGSSSSVQAGLPNSISTSHYGAYGYSSGQSGPSGTARRDSHSQSTGTTIAEGSVPQTGASRMAAAAKRGVTGADGVVRSRRGSQATQTVVDKEEDAHPLSDKSLKAR